MTNFETMVACILAFVLMALLLAVVTFLSGVFIQTAAGRMPPTAMLASIAIGICLSILGCRFTATIHPSVVVVVLPLLVATSVCAMIVWMDRGRTSFDPPAPASKGRNVLILLAGGIGAYAGSVSWFGKHILNMLNIDVPGISPREISKIHWVGGVAGFVFFACMSAIFFGVMARRRDRNEI